MTFSVVHLLKAMYSVCWIHCTQVATTPGDPNEFLTCEERGNVRLYDLRVRSSCCCEGCKRVRSENNSEADVTNGL